LVAVRVSGGVVEVSGEVPPFGFEFGMSAVIAGKLPAPRLERALPFGGQQRLAEEDSR
jgi:hypothetical protein